MTIITLPLYIQKFIIRLISHYIDCQNRLIDICSSRSVSSSVTSAYRKNEKRITTLILNMSLVSREWFKTLSKFLTVSVDFNYNDQDQDQHQQQQQNYSIIKKENIETLKLHYDHKEKSFYKLKLNGCDYMYIKIELEEVNNKIMKLSKLHQQGKGNFKNFILRNVNYQNEFEIIDSLYQCEQTNLIDICEFSLVRDSIQQQQGENNNINNNNNISKNNVEKLKKRVKNIETLIIDNYTGGDLFFEITKHWSNSIKKIIVVSEAFFYPLFQLFLDGKSNYLPNLKSLDVGPIYPIQLKQILLFGENIDCLYFKTCFICLIYNLISPKLRSIKDEHGANIFGNCKFCQKYYNINHEININNNNNNINNDNNYYSFNNNNNNYEFEEIFKRNYNIKKLVFYDKCIYQGLTKTIKDLTDSEIEIFISFLSLFKKLKIFETNIPSTELFDEIIKKNKTITYLKYLGNQYAD
ncbi:hypothetical protein ACTFIW_011759 [Dictyostelium discoideum]